MSNRLHQWGEIRRLAESMLEAAHNGLWDQVIETEAVRRELLDAFFSQPATSEEASVLEEGIRAMLQSDQEILALGRTEQQRIGGELATLSTGRKASAAYARNR